jgi:hypothetical protein
VEANPRSGLRRNYNPHGPNHSAYALIERDKTKS